MSLQAVIAIANKRWGSLESLQEQRAIQKDIQMTKKYSAIEAAKQKATEWELAPEGQAWFAKEAKHSEEAAAQIPGGSYRRNLLLDALTARGLRLPPDCQLGTGCRDFIRTGVGSPDLIADTLAGVEWLFDNTGYCSYKVSISKALALGIVQL